MRRFFVAFFIVVMLVVCGGLYLLFSFRTETLDGMKGTVEKVFFHDKLVAERHYMSGQLNGVTKIFYNSGNLKSQWSFKNGQKDGPAVHYTPEGNVRYREIYEAGQKKLRREYDESGKMIRERTFEV